jgi:hypothetical protein
MKARRLPVQWRSSLSALGRRSGATSGSLKRCYPPRSPPGTPPAASYGSSRARFPARKTLEEFDFTFQRSIKKQVIEHLGQLDFLHARENVILLGPPATGKTHLAIALAIRACLASQRVLFRTATEWVALLADAQRQGRLDEELRRLERAIPSSSATRLATSRSTRKRRTSCSCSSPAATSVRARSSPATSRSARVG